MLTGDRGAGIRAAKSALLLTALLAGASSGALAQSTPQQVPPTREEVTRQQVPQPNRQAPSLEVEGELERAPCALDSPEFANVRFTLRGVEFDGLKALSPASLTPSYAELVGTEQPISVVCAIRDRAATILRDAGYRGYVVLEYEEAGDPRTESPKHLDELRRAFA